jgi:hypothetical protein
MRDIENGYYCNKEYGEVIWEIMSGVGSLVGKFVMYVSSIYSKVVGV